MTEQTQFTKAAKRTLRKISTNRYSPRRFAFGLAWAKWAKDRPYGELLAALARVDAVLDLNPKAPTAELVEAMKTPQLPPELVEAYRKYIEKQQEYPAWWESYEKYKAALDRAHQDPSTRVFPAEEEK